MAILEEETKAKYGYYSRDIGAQSKKTIIVTCEKCGKIREIRKDSYSCLCGSCILKGRKHTKEHNQKISKGGKGLKRSEETRQRISESTKGEKHYNYGKHPLEETRRKLSKAKRGEKNPNYGKHYSKERLERMSVMMKGENNPNYGKHKSEETRRKMSEAQKGTYPSEETRRKMRGKNNPQWKGGISFGKYCPKFNERFKEYIRTKFGRVCYLCGKTEEENRQKLSVHHVNYNKNCGCAETEEGRKADDSTCQFVPLCVSCNTKVNSNRDKWEKLIKNKQRNKLNGWYI